MRFPIVIRHRKAEARIYGKRKNYPYSRVAAYVGGKRRMANYRTFSDARSAADKLVRDIAAGSQAAALTTGQANDALAALQRLDGFFRDTGRRVSLLEMRPALMTLAILATVLVVTGCPSGHHH